MPVVNPPPTPSHGTASAGYQGAAKAVPHTDTWPDHPMGVPLAEHITSLLNQLDRRYQQRAEAQFDALQEADRRYQQRYEAQQEALQAALLSAEKAIESALVAVEKGSTKADAAREALEAMVQKMVDRVTSLAERVDGLDRLTDAKFITFRTLIDSQAEKVALALAASDKAVQKAEVANEKRFDSVNEFRAQLTDQAATFMPRHEAEARWNGLAEKIDDLKERLGATVGRSAGLAAGWGYMVASVGLAAAVVGIIVATR
jgi:hypothetical protein